MDWPRVGRVHVMPDVIMLQMKRIVNVKYVVKIISCNVYVQNEKQQDF